MSSENFKRYWLGPILAAFGVAAILWLAATGRLSWYVHPRYIFFTVAMCAIAATLLIAAAPLLRQARASSERGEDLHASAANHRRGRLGLVASAALIAGSAVALLVLPPATLSSDLAQQRQGNAGLVGVQASQPAIVDPTEATVKDWAMQLRLNGGAALERQEAVLLGFVMPDPFGEDELFQVSRFSISCCAVDAMPLGVPVYSPGWQQSLSEGEWVSVEGMFVANPAVTSPSQTVFLPISVSPTEEPSEPYVY